MIYQKVKYVLDRLQSLKSSIINDLKDDQILMLQCVNSFAFQATAACDAHGRVVINNAQSGIDNISTMMT